jgi:hypothetical protein
MNAASFMASGHTQSSDPAENGALSSSVARLDAPRSMSGHATVEDGNSPHAVAESRPADKRTHCLADAQIL